MPPAETVGKPFAFDFGFSFSFGIGIHPGEQADSLLTFFDLDFNLVIVHG